MTSGHANRSEPGVESARLAAVADALAGSSEHAVEFDAMLALATRLLDSPVGLVSLVDDERQHFVAEIGLADEPVGGTPLSHSFCKLVVSDREPLVIVNSSEDPRVADNPAVAELGVVAYCGFPIVDHDGHVLGSLCAIDHKPHDWSADDLEILQALARGVGARLSLENRHRSLVRSLNDRVLHLPEASQEWDVTAAYRPASGSVLGGDFYDVVEDNDGARSLVIADVVGHGIEATVATAQLQAAARTVMSIEPELLACAEHLDRAAARLDGAPYAAITLARIDSHRSMLEHVCCGALPPMLVGDDGSARFLDHAQTPPLTFPGTRQTAHTQLGPWSALVFYTDGLVERRGEDLDVGLGRLAEHAHLVSRDDPAAALVSALGTDRDDVAVVVVRPKR